MVNWRYAGLVAGAALGLLLVGLLIFPERSSLVAKGPMNTGHEGMACQECHAPVPGTAAQQFSSNVHHWLGLREHATGFGSQDVGSAICLDCHERPDDRHPISRFLESRFADQRQHIAAHTCIACHTEHHGMRVTRPTTGFCTHCHQDTSLEEDPISPTHEELVQTESWTTCLQCHDFHGNHVRTTPVSLDEGVPEEQVWDYFLGGPSPYGDEKHADASSTRISTEP